MERRTVVGSKFSAGMSIYTKAVLCDGRGRPPQDLRQKLRIIMECVSWLLRIFCVNMSGSRSPMFSGKKTICLEL